MFYTKKNLRKIALSMMVMGALSVGNFSNGDVFQPVMAEANALKKDVLFRDTVADMVKGDGLKQGDKVKTRGFFAKGDGFDEEYLIQDKAGAVDGDSVIKLNNGLFAIRTSGVKELSGFFGTFFTSNENVKAEAYYTSDGVTMKYVMPLEGQAGRDPSIQYHNQMFYLCYVEPIETGRTFRIAKTRDFKKWETRGYNVIDRTTLGAVWAPDLFIDDDGKAYVYFAKQREENKEPTQFLMDLYVSSCDDIEKGEFGPAVKIEMPKRSDSYIDAQVRKINGTYYMIAKDEKKYTDNYNKAPLLLKSTSPVKGFQEVETWPLQAIKGYEGFSFFNDNGTVYIYGDNYAKDFDLSPKSRATVWMVDERKIETGPYSAEYLKSPNTLRHGTVIPLKDNNYFKRMLINMHKFPFKDNVMKDADKVKVSLKQYLPADSAQKDVSEIDKFAPGQGVVYEVPKKQNVVIKKVMNAYGVPNMRFVFEDAKSGSLEIEGKKIPADKNEHVFQYDNGKWNYMKK
ncbi:Glycosyl hydrolases family 43 [Selenomonas ruminantium]|uniref:Glycosyl hydrolases family 43 n=1 Tax=Selenomonas ruminantium TaxID=971 RepID=A0A1M6TEI3_SELRU|nr:family 43 glycosylhydrolase [Selenomonas ruminantium]SHK55299.1 Glycosyl hydrolases family 43 [Selenomonas ruminantium]